MSLFLVGKSNYIIHEIEKKMSLRTELSARNSLKMSNSTLKQLILQMR
jgi:hypothetical protein